MKLVGTFKQLGMKCATAAVISEYTHCNAIKGLKMAWYFIPEVLSESYKNLYRQKQSYALVEL